MEQFLLKVFSESVAFKNDKCNSTPREIWKSNEMKFILLEDASFIIVLKGSAAGILLLLIFAFPYVIAGNQ